MERERDWAETGENDNAKCKMQNAKIWKNLNFKFGFEICTLSFEF